MLRNCGCLRQRLQVDFLPCSALRVGVDVPSQPGASAAGGCEAGERFDAAQADQPVDQQRAIDFEQLVERHQARPRARRLRSRRRAACRRQRLPARPRHRGRRAGWPRPGTRARCRAPAAAASTERSRRHGRAETGTCRCRPRPPATRPDTPDVRAACSRLASRDWNSRSASRLAMGSVRVQASAPILAISSAGLTGLTM